MANDRRDRPSVRTSSVADMALLSFLVRRPELQFGPALRRRSDHVRKRGDLARSRSSPGASAGAPSRHVTIVSPAFRSRSPRPSVLALKTTATGVAARHPVPTRSEAIVSASLQSHHHDHGDRVRRQHLQQRPVARLRVARDDQHAGRQAPVRHGDAGQRRRRKRGRDAGHDLEGHARGARAPAPLRRRARRRTGLRP